MTDTPAPLAPQAGAALFWNGMHLVAARVISLVRFLILARILAPDDFGLLAIAWIAIELLLTLSDFGMIPALVQRREVEERHYDAAWTVGLVRAVAVAVVVAAAAPWIAAFFEEPRATPILQVLAVAPVVSALASAKLAALTRALRFRSLTFVKVPDALAEAVVSIALASLLGVWALVVGVLTAAVVRVVLSYLLAPHRPRVSFDMDAAGELFRFGRWLFVTGVLGVLGEALLRAVISRRLGTAELGIFYMAVRLAMMPLQSVQAAVGPIGLPVHARLQADRERVARALQVSLVGTAAVVVPSYAVLAVLAPALARDVLGAGWAAAGQPIRLLAVAAAVAVVASAARPMLLGLGRPQIPAALTALSTSVLVGAGYVLAGVMGVVGAALAWLLTDVLLAGAWALAARRTLGRGLPGVARQLTGVLLTAAAGGAAAWLVGSATAGVVGFVVAAVAGLGVAGAALWLLDERLRLDLRSTAVRMFPVLGARLGRTAPSS